MVRLEGWEKRFSEYLSETKDKDHVWGENDCVLFPVKAVEIITGENHYQEYLGYTDEAGAEQIKEENGGLENLISKHFGQPHSNIMKARRGDLVYLRISGMNLIGIVDDTGQKICFANEGGYTRVSLKFARKVWSYG